MKNFLSKKNKSNKDYESFNEAYRLLRTNLKYSFPGDNSGKIILVTSAEQGDGKSTTSCNLSKKLSELNKKVLLIDIDIRKPTQHRNFGLSNIWGLTDIIAGECKMDKGKQRINEHLDIITTGKNASTASELISSNEFKVMLKKLRSEYDYIIVDSAPINIISDAIAILNDVDGIILVAMYRKTKKRSIQSVCKKITQLDGKILGVVFNGVETNANSYYYYYYQNSYYYEKRKKRRN